MSNFLKRSAFSNKNKDFEQQSLPFNRKQLFKKIFTTRFGKLIQINLLCFLFLLPIIIWNFLTTIYKSSLTDASEQIYLVLYVKSPLVIVFTLIAFLGIAGTIYYIRRLSWSEPVSLFRTFSQGIKQSYKQFLGFGFITSIFICLLDLSFTMLAISEISTIYMIIFYALLITAITLFLSILSYSLTLSSLYVMNFFSIIKNSIILTIKKIPSNLLFILLTYGIVSVWFFIGIIYLYFLGVFIVAFIGISYSTLIWISFTNSSYDALINIKQYPEIYRKGLRPLIKEETKNV